MNKKQFVVSTSRLYTITNAKPISQSKVFWKKANSSDIELISIHEYTKKKLEKKRSNFFRTKRRSLADSKLSRQKEKNIPSINKENLKKCRLKTILVDEDLKSSSKIKTGDSSEIPRIRSLKFLRGTKKSRRSLRTNFRTVLSVKTKN